MQKRRGFTLIELLVVIAIIAILAAILFPVFLAAKAAGAKASCSANLKQISSAYRLYWADWNDYYPQGPWGAKFFLLLKYMPSTRYKIGANAGSIDQLEKSSMTVWLCPAAPKNMGYLITASRWLSEGREPYWWRWDSAHSQECQVFNSYAQNADVGYHTSHVANPSKMVFYGESAYIKNGTVIGNEFGSAYAAVHPSCYHGGDCQGWWKPGNNPYSQSRLYPWHDEGSNFLWVDGHVTYAKMPPPLQYWKNPQCPDGKPIF